jgi:hypothetical protein
MGKLNFFILINKMENEFGNMNVAQQETVRRLAAEMESQTSHDDFIKALFQNSTTHDVYDQLLRYYDL